VRPMPAAEPVLTTLVDRARAANPTLSAGNAAIAAARSRSTLADKAWYPDVTIGGGPLIQTNHQPVGFAATVGLNIPVPWGREASGQQEAAAQLGASQQRYDAALLEIEGALGEGVAKLHAARATETLLRREAMPQARATFQTVLANYSQGKGDLTVAITAEHQIHETELRLLQTQLDEQVELAALERLVGGEL
jgi:cobalt-zinc-cadmium efflux system outer membrane protein